MLVGVDAGCLGIQDKRLKVGVYYMAVSLFQELGKIDTINTYLLYSFYPIEKALVRSFGKNFKNIVVKPVRGWTKIWLPLQLLKDKPDVFVGLNQSLPLKLPFQKYKGVVVVHDTLFEQFPKMYPGSFRKLHKETKSAAGIADTVIVPSFATKKDVESYYKISDKKIMVIPEGVRTFPKDKINTKYKILDTKYFLFVGALKPQKNVPTLLNAFAQMISPKGTSYRVAANDKGSRINKDIELFVVGGDKWRDREIDRTLKRIPQNVQKRIHFLRVVDDGELGELYKNAIAFVCPSLSEGFGLTFLEAMSFSTPVIGPKEGSVPEVVGDAGMLVDPTDTKAISKAMEKLLDPKIRLEFSKKASIQSQKFSWTTFARGFIGIIQS